MRSLWGLLALVAVGLAADATTKKPPNPVDVANTDKAKKARDDALEAEKTAQKAFLAKAEESADCQKKLAAAEKKYAATQKNLADIKALDGVLKIDTAKAITTKQKATKNPTTDPDTAFDIDAAALKARNTLQDQTDATKGTCGVAKQAVKTAKKSYDDAVTKTKEKQKEFEDKSKIAPPTGAAKGADPPLNKYQLAAKDARKKEREAAEKLSKAYKKNNNCPAEVTQLQKDGKIATDHATLIDSIQAKVDAADKSTKQAEMTADTTAIKPYKTRADKEKTAVEKPVEDKKTECQGTADKLKEAKDAHDKAKKAADEAQKVADNPSLQTTGATTKATTAASTTKKTSGASAASGATTKKGDGSSTTAKPGSSANPSSSGKKDEGPDATQNVDGVPLSPDQPCCQKAAAGLCASNIFFRNQCNTECGCEKAKGTCTGQPPKKCRKDGKSGNPDTAAAAAPTPKPCSDKAGSECTEWSTRTTQSPGGRTAKECSVDVGYYMQNQCTKSCNLCGKTADIDEYFCWGWAYIGECTGSAAAWMKKFCALSCANVEANGKPNASLRLRKRRLAKIARARTLRRIKAARLAAVAKVKRRRAMAGRRSRAIAARRAAGRLRFGRARIAALRRRKLQLARRKAKALANN